MPTDPDADAEIPEGWYGPTDRIELRRNREARGAALLYEWFGDRLAVANEQAAWLHLHDEYRAQLEASGMPADIADELGGLLDDGGGILLASGESGFVLIRPDGHGLSFGTTTSEAGHRVMDISELDSEEMRGLFETFDTDAIIDAMIDLGLNRPDLDAGRALLEVFAGLAERTELSLQEMYERGLDRDVFTRAEWLAAAGVDADQID